METDPAQLLTEILKLKKPYLIEVEQLVKQIAHGTLDLTIHIRAGEVEKMELHQRKVWLKAKA